MGDEKGEVTGGGVEWRMNMVGVGSSKISVSEAKSDRRRRLDMKVYDFMKKAWEMGASDPRKLIHCLKVGVALTIVSLFYYVRPLYDGVGGNAMWAVMTVVVAFEYTAGATVYKTLNRICGTSLAGFLGIAIHWIASEAGEKLEPVIVGASLFLLASAATFSRFIPSIKARFDYGALIFILTFSLVSVSGYRVDELFHMAHQRISTILIGSSLCILISIFICPIWAGEELYLSVTRNLDRLANSLDGCIAQYLKNNSAGHGGVEVGSVQEVGDGKSLLGYKCVLNSKASEDSMVNFAIWEPPHGRFNFRHPWKQYLKVGASSRSCGSCLDALHGCISSEDKAADLGDVQKHMNEASLKVASRCSSVMRELGNMIRRMEKSSGMSELISDMNSAAQELEDVLNSHSILMVSDVNNKAARSSGGNGTSDDDDDDDDDDPMAMRKAESTAMATIPLMAILPAVTVASLLVEIVGRVEDMVDAVEKLADLADFKIHS